MIKPTVGRVVWFWMPNSPQKEPLAAMVAAVITDSIVNLSVIDAEGNQFGQKGVPLVQDGEKSPAMAYCEWMPYQKGQAAKTEALQASLGAKP
jgi:hypothetical protein